MSSKLSNQKRKKRNSTHSASVKRDRSPHLQVLYPSDKRVGLRVKWSDYPLRGSTLGDLDLAAKVEGPSRFEPALLVMPLSLEKVAGIETVSIKVFRMDTTSKTLKPIWNSGANATFNFVWAKVSQPGTYVALGLPRDRLVQQVLRYLSRQREFEDWTEGETPERSRKLLLHFLDRDDLEPVRDFLARMEAQTGFGANRYEFRLGKGAHVEAFALPGGQDFDSFRKRLARLKVPPTGLPEEALLDPPDTRTAESPWPTRLDLDLASIAKTHFTHQQIHSLDWLRDFFPWFFSQDWWMYQHDSSHRGRASGWSDIMSTTVNRLFRQSTIAVNGPVITKPAIVDGKVYIGTGRLYNGSGGTLYKIDLATGVVEYTFPTSGTAYYSSYQGIGGSPAVTGGRVYLTGVHGKVYCLNAADLSFVWETDLKTANVGKNQPVNNPAGDSWSSPLVVNGKVYVGSGEGESSQPFGFVWCLDASTGNVVWVYCMNKFVDPNNPGNENQPSVIPRSAAISDPLPAWATATGFSLHNDPPHKGAAVWSSCCYVPGLNRIYVCSGNSRPDNPLPDERYASGMISLDANTGGFRGFFQPTSSDSYTPGDFDVDVPGATTYFERAGVNLRRLRQQEWVVLHPRCRHACGCGEEATASTPEWIWITGRCGNGHQFRGSSRRIRREQVGCDGHPGPPRRNRPTLRWSWWL